MPPRSPRGGYARDPEFRLGLFDVAELLDKPLNNVGAVMTKHRIFTTSVASVYPHYVTKAEKKGRTKAEVDEIFRWLTGYSQEALEAHLGKRTDFETFFADAPEMNPARALISGDMPSVTPSPCSAASSIAGTLSSHRCPRGVSCERPASLSQVGQARGCVVKWISTARDRSSGVFNPPLTSAGAQTGKPFTVTSGSNFSPVECSRP